MTHGPRTYQHREGDAQQWLCRFGVDDRHSVTGVTTKTAVSVRGDETVSRSGSLVSLSWHTTDPFAITLLVHDHVGAEPTIWLFARELLVNGGGVGDVRVRHGLVTSIDLDSPDEQITLRLSVSWVEQFVRYTQEVMPLGAEPSLVHAGEPEWTAELARLVGGPER